MSATTRQLEFAVEMIDLDDGAELSLKLQALTPRAVAWLQHHGAHAVTARLNALGDKPAHEIADTLQDLLEADAGLARTQLAPPSAFVSGATDEFSVEFEPDPDDEDGHIATISGLTERARGWLTYQGSELWLVLGRGKHDGERLADACQRLLVADLGPAE